MPDREYDCVALFFSKAQRNALAACTQRFNDVKNEFSDLYRLEFQAATFQPSRVLLDGQAPYDPPEGLTRLDEYLEGLDTPEVALNPLGVTPFLVVTQQGVYVTWEGRRERYGPNERYETAIFSAEDVGEALEP